MELHLQVKQARKEAGLTQEELAARAKVGRTDVSRFERGDNVTMKTFLRLVRALPDLKDLTIDDLHVQKEGAATPDGGDALRRMETALLDSVRGQIPPAPQTPPPSNDGATFQLQLLRALGQLDIAGGKK